MSNRVNPDLLLNLKEYGAVGAEICFNCGNCTAVCPLTSDEHPFPRNMIRLAQLGLEERITQSTDPWLCYYCGDCAQSCPRQAEPGGRDQDGHPDRVLGAPGQQQDEPRQQ